MNAGLPGDSPTELAWANGRDRLVRFLRARGASHDDAEDIVHDILLKAMDRREGGSNAVDALPGWLHRAAMNALVDRARRDGTRRRNAITAEPVFDPRNEPQSREGLYDCLEPFLAHLDAGDREVLLLADRDGMPQAEIALRLGLSLSGAKSRIQRARRRLRDVYEKCCAFELDSRGGIAGYTPRCDCGDGCEGSKTNDPGPEARGRM